jgi:transcriptional regulator with XRE-family HTH domain
MSTKFVLKRIISNTDPWDFSAREKMNSQSLSGLLKKARSTILTTPSHFPNDGEKMLREEKPRVLVSKSMEETFQRLKNKPSRDAYVEADLVNSIASQIRVLRQQRGWSQKELAEKINTSQGVISRLEDPSYGKFSIKSLLQLAAIFDVSIVTRFLPFSQAVPITWDTKTGSLEADGFENDFKRIYFYSKSDINEHAKYKKSFFVGDTEKAKVNLRGSKPARAAYLKTSVDLKLEI